jgi:hypothetical protein
MYQSLTGLKFNQRVNRLPLTRVGVEWRDAALTYGLGVTLDLQGAIQTKSSI